MDGMGKFTPVSRGCGGIVPPWLAIAALVALCACAGLAATGESPRRLGGCQTTQRVYGLPACTDSLAMLAIDELLAPGVGPRTGPACRALAVDTPLFLQVGAIDPPADTLWVELSRALSARVEAAQLRLASRTLLSHTTGTCFPPYHVDLRACGDSAQVAAFLRDLPDAAWPGFTRAGVRAQREVFISAGVSLQGMAVAIDLRRDAVDRPAATTGDPR
jgi:hypothetical protein